MRLKKKWWVLAFTAAATVCLWFWLTGESSPLVISDYAAGADGLVVDTAGKPIVGATVSIAFDEPVFDAITPVRISRLTTDQSGKFAEHFISCGKPAGQYTISVSKEGFASARIKGSGVGSHRIVLRPTPAVAARPNST